MLLHELDERLGRKPQHGAVAYSCDRGRPRFARDESHLAHDLASAALGKDHVTAVVTRHAHPQPAHRDDIERIGIVALADEDVAPRQCHRFETFDEE